VTKAETPSLEVWRNPPHRMDIVLDEPEWRTLPPASATMLSEQRVTATRWHALTHQTREHSAETADHNYVVKITLRSMNFCLSVSGRTVHDGIIAPGICHVTEPAASVRCLFRGPYDVLHLHVAKNLVAECARDTPGHQPPVLSAEPTRDPVVEQLARALLDARQVHASFRQLYTDSVSVAIVARLLVSARQANPSVRPKVAGLPRWRLMRAIDYVEAHLAEPVSLADVAAATGLTRMHFAAQFRAATGLRPHEYLLRRRIERAQELLVRTEMSVVSVAHSVGFHTQSHFTTIFKRFAGHPPQTWRRTHGSAMTPGVLSG
jgi:AraC family transcriptional regulator